jgi:hypothetical protein
VLRAGEASRIDHQMPFSFRVKSGTCFIAHWRYDKQTKVGEFQTFEYPTGSGKRVQWYSVSSNTQPKNLSYESRYGQLNVSAGTSEGCVADFTFTPEHRTP